MINEDFITTLKTRWMTTEINVLREYFQHNFLNNLYRLPQANKLFFKGGTVLRIIYQSPRFSEDLDFSSLIYSSSIIEKLIEEILIQLHYQGIEVDMSEAKPTTGGYLFVAKTNLLGKEIGLKLNFVFKKKIEGESHVIRCVFIPAYNLIALKKQTIICEKIEALLTRAKSRDFFDLYYILRARLGKEIVIEQRDEILKLIEKTKDGFADLKQFLPKNFWPIIKELGKNLKSELTML
jgi:predicted nucleotidyltransferase component of viral defense system